MKAGWKTTEFWLTVVSSAMMVLVALGIVNMGDAAHLEDAAAKAAAAAFVFIANIAVIVKYIQGRLNLKEAESFPTEPPLDDTHAGSANLKITRH